MYTCFNLLSDSAAFMRFYKNCPQQHVPNYSTSIIQNHFRLIKPLNHTTDKTCYQGSVENKQRRTTAQRCHCWVF